MSRVRYGVGPWAVATPPKPRAFPTRPDRDRADVVVVGAGLTGILTATALKQAGHAVVLIDADRVGAGHSRAAVGLCGLLLGSDYRGLEAMHGRKLARGLMSAVTDAGSRLTAGLKKARITASVDGRRLVSAVDPSVRGWDKEAAVRVDAGLSATRITGAALRKATTAELAAAMHLGEVGMVDPSRLVTAAIARLVAERVTTFEKCLVRSITFTRTEATVHVGTHAIVAPRVVVCTDAPGVLAPTLDRHVRGFEHHHVLTAPMPAAMRKAVALAGTVLVDKKAALAVTATADGRLLLTGGDGPIVSPKQRDAAHVQRTGQLMYECLKHFPVIVGLAPEFGWSTPVVAAPDRFPLVGAHRQYPHQLFSFGTDHDPALAFAASRVLVRAVAKAPQAGDDIFGFGRVQEERA